MFAPWQQFYMLIGTAAAGLIGLLFVVATLTSGLDPERSSRGADLFLTPTVFVFASVLAISAVALIPRLDTPFDRGAAGLVAVVGGINLTAVTFALRRGEAPGPLHWSDLWCYGVVPVAAYLFMFVAALLPESRQAVLGVSGAALFLLLLAVRNAWDLVTVLAAAARKRAAGQSVDPPVS